MTIPKIEKGDICDFCGDPNPTRVYQSEEIEIEAMVDDHEAGGMSFDSDWAACEICGDLIDAGSWDGLFKRASNEFYAHHLDVALRTFGNEKREQGMADALKLLYNELRNKGLKRVS